jgi:hypothetical protein
MARSMTSLGVYERSGTLQTASVLNLKFSGLQIDSNMADAPHFGEDWLWADVLLRWNSMRLNLQS